MSESTVPDRQPDRRTDDQLAAPIQCILSDVDGVLTDGRITYDSAGCESKSFHVRDGLGIKIWMRSGFRFGIITARQSDLVARRAAELGIDAVLQNQSDKSAAAATLLAGWNLTLAQTAYIGDDLPDLPVMLAAGLSVAPADAARDVRESADWVLDADGGTGAVRELVERLLRAGGRWDANVPSLAKSMGSSAQRDRSGWTGPRGESATDGTQC